MKWLTHRLGIVLSVKFITYIKKRKKKVEARFGFEIKNYNNYFNTIYMHNLNMQYITTYWVITNHNWGYIDHNNAYTFLKKFPICAYFDIDNKLTYLEYFVLWFII